MRYWCNTCGSYQEFKVSTGPVRAGDNGTICDGTIWSCKNCNFVPFLPPKPEGKEDGKQGSSSNS